MPVMQMFAENGAADGAVKFLQHLNAGGDGYDEMQVQYAYKALANSKHVPNNKLKSNPVTVKQLEKDWYAQRQAISTVNQILEEGQTKIRRKLIARDAIDPKEKTKMYSRAVWESMVPAVYFHPKATTTRQNQVHQNQINQAKMGWKRDDAAMTAELWACANDLRYYIPALRVSHDTIVRDAKRAMAKAQERKQIPSEMMEALLEVRLQLGQTHEQVFRYLETRQQQDSTPTAIWNVYRPIVENLLETNDIETLFAMYDTLTKRQVNFLPSSFVPVFEKFAETGDLDNALRLLLMAREKDVPITEKMVLLLIKTCCEAGGTRGLQGVNSLVAGKRSYDPLGQRTWASIIKNCEQTFGEEAALDIYAQLLEGFHVRFSFADAMEVSAEETAEFEQKEFVPPAMEKAVPRGVTGGSLAGYVKTLKEGVKHHTKQSLHQEVEDMLEQCQLTEIVDINHCVDVLTKHAGGKNLTPYVTSSLLDLYVQNSMNNNGDFEQLNAFAERIPLRAAHVDVVLQHLTNLAARDDNIKQIVDNFIEKTSSTYPGGKFDKLGSHLRAFQYYSATRNPVGCKEQFGHLEQHQMNPKKFAILISEYVATLIVNRDFKFISQIFDTHLASGNVKFTDGQLADFATRLYTSRTPDGKKFAKAVFSLITNLDGTKTDYQYKLNLIQCYSLNGQTEKAQLVYDKIEAEGQKDGHWANVFLLRAYTNDGSLKSMANAEELMKKKSSGDTRAFAIGLMIQGYAKVCSTGESDPEIFKKFSKYLAELSGMGNAPNRDTLVAVSSVLAEEQINRTALFNKMYSKIASQADAKAMLRAYGTKLLSRNDLHGRGKDLNTIGLLVETIKQREDVDHENFLFFLKKYMHSSSPSKFQKLFNLLPMIARNDNRLKKTTLTAHMIRLEHLAMRGTPDGLAKALVETISTCGSDINEAQKSDIKRICTSRGLPSPY